MAKSNDKIDFVVLWVDGADPAWLAEKKKWEKKLGIAKDPNIDASDERYRDPGLLKYWFRGVEKFAPWVNKIHFVTCGHVPEWLNVNHPKLHIVKHSDFMPKEALPTFNTNAIELSIHKIKGLSEKFVLFNDDTFIVKNVKPTEFFKDNLPCNTMSLVALTPDKTEPFYRTICNNMEIINKYFEFAEFKKNVSKNLSLKQRKYVLKTAPLLVYKLFPSFASYHMPNSYLKSTLKEVWGKEGEVLSKTVKNKFRNYEEDHSDWLFNYWQFASGTYKQKKSSWGKNTRLTDGNIPKYIEGRKYSIVCLNDVPGVTEDAIANIKESFDKILSERCEFEKMKKIIGGRVKC